MKKSSKIQIILSIAVLIVLTIVANFTDVNQVLFSASPKVVLPPSKDVFEAKDMQQVETSRTVENPFQTYLDKKSKDPVAQPITTTGTVARQTDAQRDPFKEFLDKQKSRDYASSASPFDAPVQKGRGN
jgi:hypothetical protein